MKTAFEINLAGLKNPRHRQVMPVNVGQLAYEGQCYTS